jgi:predicted ABC-type transport system involved in lysophospholipase L1 biosynthesis ATPase subunit
VLITHDIEVAEAADRAVHIRDGQLHEQAALVGTRT